MTTSVVMIRSAPGGDGTQWRAGLTYAAADDFARALIGRGDAYAADGSLPDVSITAAQAAALDDGTILGSDGTVYALSEVIPEVLANASATTTVLTGAGTYAGYRCTTAAGNITVYDALSATGKVLVPTTALAVGSFPIYGAGHPGRIAIGTGVTVVLSGAAVVYAGVEAA